MSLATNKWTIWVICVGVDNIPSVSGYLLEVVTAGKLKISVPGCVLPGKKRD